MAISKCTSKFVLTVILDTTDILRIRILRQCATTSSKDVLENFTDNLMEEKARKWRSRNLGLNAKYRLAATNQNLTEAFANPKESVDSLVLKAIRSNRCEYVIPLLKAYREKNEFPSSKVLLEAASFFGRSGNEKGLIMVQQICEHFDKEEFNNQAQYKHYMAEARWTNGNIEAALKMFAEVYHNHNFLKRKVRSLIRFLFSECIHHRSEASMVIIKRFSLTFAEKHGDIFFVSCLWRSCFFSDWFSDQQLAAELLRESEKLREIIKGRAYHLALAELKARQVTVVYRILEMLLLYDMKLQYNQVLRALFDYKCYRGDVKGCVAILESASQLDIALNTREQIQFLYLLASDEDRLKLKQLIKQCKHSSIVVPKYNLKF